MKMKRIPAITVITIIVLSCTMIVTYNASKPAREIRGSYRWTDLARETDEADQGYHFFNEPLEINGNEELAAMAVSEGWPGSGNINDPFIIQGYNISSTQHEHGLIVINNTDYHVMVRDCLVTGGKYGIYLDNVTNAMIRNNTITDTGVAGMVITNAAGNTISCNNVTGNWGAGIEHSYSTDNSISGNTVTICNIMGIFNFHSNDSVFEGNAVVNNWEGVVIASSKGNVFTANNVTENIYEGVNILYSIMNSFQNNLIMNNNDSGFDLENSDSNIVIHNKLVNNGNEGIELINAGNNTVMWNDFINNRRNYPQYDYGQAYDGLNEGENNTFDYNHWNDWITPDNDTNGIVDEPYAIYGDSNSMDPHPRVTAHVLTAPDITHPIGGETLAGTVTISWEAGSDSLEHEVSYTVYYSDDSGSSWYQLGTGIAGTTCSWNTLEVVDGNTYRVKVVATCTAGWTAEDVSEGDFTVDNSITTSSTENTGTSTVTGYLLAAALVSLFAGVRLKKRRP